MKLFNSSMIFLIPLILLCSINVTSITSSLSPKYHWNLIDIGIEDAWEYTKGNSDITVAVIDTGVDFTHLDLVNQSWKNLGEITDNGKDDDGNGYIDDTNGGWDFRDDDNDPSPILGSQGFNHGTYISGLIAADDDNDISVGVAPNIRIMALRFLNIDFGWGPGDWPMFINAIDYAIDNNADIIHMSVQAISTPPVSFKEAIQRAYQKQIPVVSVTGNSNVWPFTSDVRYPGNYPEVIAVSATNQSHELADFSCFGSQNEICAPGEAVYSIEPNSNDLILNSGTSFAAPLVSATIALILSVNSTIPIEEIRTILHEACTDLGSVGKDDYFGYGLLNVSAALRNVTETYGNVSTSIQGSESTTTNRINGFESFNMVCIAIIGTILYYKRKSSK